MKALVYPDWDLNIDSEMVNLDRRIVIPGEFCDPVVKELSEISVSSMFNVHSVRKIALTPDLFLFNVDFFKLSF